MFQKNLNFFPDVDNDMIYQRAKFEIDIPNITITGMMGNQLTITGMASGLSFKVQRPNTMVKADKLDKMYT
jgi:hypothetical protein